MSLASRWGEAGVGVGGHCIPIDPMYLNHHVVQRLGQPLRFVELAQEVNTSMPAYVVDRAQDLLDQRGQDLRGARVLMLGVTYKPDIADDRESPAVPLAEELIARGARVEYHDPLVRRWSVDGANRVSDADLGRALEGADIAVLVQKHGVYDVDALARRSRLFLDTSGTATEAVAERL
ncbi:UDP binding domain-containing protein [Cellulomonas rhizosphaerae]|uniref:UDP-glucose/GDP-mannose dehydrogenase C-terminal domain-containing protein n=1 Tax=Cellulomonas rhizosphaerae TaxID=2293719 RepID=A0A413RI73_9CELL|nr:UDP binding domain-containing protein [Cellulomonas rhizosphaerae]RHA37912.1 hypothetical protein D1825_15950 [Cellulomonas rhizosphaerae]